VPTIRDARGQLIEYRVEPIGSPSGPVERVIEPSVVASPAAPAMPSDTLPGNGLGRFPLPRDKEQRNAAVLAALRATTSVRAAAERLHVSETRVGQLIHEMRRAGVLPDDVSATLRSRANSAGRRITARDLAAIEPTTQEADAPATDVDEPGPTGDATPAEQVATPPGLLPVVPSSAVAVEEAVNGTVLHLTVRIDAAELARAMQGWPNYQIQPFVDGLARILAAAKR
jgi:hypothetical protein